MMLALVLMLIPNVGVGAWWGPVYGGVQGLVPPAMRALSAAVLLFVINIIGLGGGPTSFGIVTDIVTSHYLLPSGLDLVACKTAVGDIKATCAAASAHGIKTTVYLSTLVLPLAMLCFFVSRWTIPKDVERAEITSPAISMTKLNLYMMLGAAIPGLFLGNASAMFFPKAPHGGLWGPGILTGAVIGALVGLILAAYMVAENKSKMAKAS